MFSWKFELEFQIVSRQKLLKIIHILWKSHAMNSYRLEKYAATIRRLYARKHRNIGIRDRKLGRPREKQIISGERQDVEMIETSSVGNQF